MAVTLVGSLFTTVALSQAWFSKTTSLTPGWSGTSDGAYFAYGNGVKRNQENEKDQPYGITSPRHLYNLAWLQYLGFFNELDGNNYTTYYFELANDVDMTGWTLPPIGTRENPFLGNFSGNGYKITGLTISNDLSDYNQKPFGITESDFPDEINVLGLFGVVGSYQGGQNGRYLTSENEITNTGISSLTVESHSTTSLVGLAAGYVNGTLFGVAVNDSYLDLSGSGGAAITSVTSNISDYSLIGYAANDSYLETLKSSQTRYDDPLISNPYVSAGGDEWGGSIPMKEMYTALSTKMKRGQKYTSQSYVYFEEQTRTNHGDGTYTPVSGYTPIPGNTRSQTYTDTNTTHLGVYLYDGVDTTTDSKGDTYVSGSYTFGSDYASGNINNDPYVGLLGNNQLDYTYTLRSDTIWENGYLLYDSTAGATRNYFYWDGTNVSSTTNQSNASVLLRDPDYPNSLFVRYNNVSYYLSVNNGSLVVGTQYYSECVWDSTYSAFKLDDTYYLICLDGFWQLSTSTTVNHYYYSISNGNGRYLTNNGTTGLITVNTNNPANAARWYFDNYNGTNYIYTTINNVKYYVRCTRTGNWYNYTYNFSLNQTFDATSSLYLVGNNQLAGSFSGTIRYLTISNNGVSTNTNSQNLTIQSTLDHATTYLTTNSAATYVDYEDYQETRHYNTRETYFPLTWTKDSTTDPSIKNTGYVISGSNYSTDSNDSIGDIRFSSYYTRDMLGNSNSNAVSGNSHSNITFSDAQFFPYSFNQSGNLVRIGDPVNNLMNTSGYTSYTDTSLNGTGFKKYYSKLLTRVTGSRYTIGDYLTKDSIAYGLHFMNADISMDNLINVPYAKINGSEYYNYTLPRDAIDFNLKTDGYVNFFAHTAFVNGTESSPTWNNSNNSFFSLHWIDRDGNGIDGIKQIAKIYKNTAFDTDETQPRYLYTFRDSNDNEVTTAYNASTNPNGYHTGQKDDQGNLIVGSKGDLIFDTYWLTDPEYSKFKLYAVYYFEIPVNKGEYALGSTSGKTKYARGWGNSYTSYNKNGAYLIYLDIGASQKNTSAVTIDEHAETTTKTYKYPKGVDYVDLTTLTTVAAYSAVQGGKSSAIRLTAVEANKINIEYNYQPKTNNADALLTVGPDNGAGSYTATYTTIDTDVKNGALVDITIDAISTSVDVMDREILYDLTTNVNNYIVTEKHTIDGVEQTPVMVTTTESWTETQIASIASFDAAGETLFSLAYSVPGTEAVNLETSFNTLTRIYTLNFTSASGGQNVHARFLTINPTYTFEGDSSSTFDYTIVVMSNGETLATIDKNNYTSYVGVDLTLVVAIKNN